MPTTGDPRWVALTRAAIALAIAATVATLLAVSYFAWEARQQSQKNESLIKNAEQTNQQIVDCTTPGGRCFEDSQRRTAEVVEMINRSTIYAAYCARTVEDPVNIGACVADALRKAETRD